MCYIIKKANWKLYDNDIIIINQEKINLFFEKGILRYNENEGINNIIFLKKQIYIRESFDYKFEFDFKNKSFLCNLKEQNLEVTGEMLVSKFNNSIENNNLLILEYSIEENDLKRLEVQML